MKIRAPGIRLRWLLLSLFVNAAVLAVVLPITLSDREPEPGDAIARIDGSEMPPLREEVKPDFRETKPIEQEERVIEDPVVKDAKVSDHNETDSDMPFEESLGQKDFLSDAPFEGPSTNAAIGIGGGAGGAFGGRAGRARFPGDVEAPPTDREGYDAVEEEGFLDPRRSPLSTFSIDVDTASYANVRRFLVEGRRPPAGAVRIEEMLNYFSYGYAAPASGEPFAVTTEVGPCPWAPAHRLVHIGIQGRRVPANEVPPRNLVFLLDVSGSMQSADKLPLVVSAMKLLTEQLSSTDRVAIVVYAGASGLVLPSTPGSAKGDIFDALSRLRAGGSTNGGDGIRLAYRIARENRIEGGVNRVILATDGDFNVGTTSRSDLTDLIEKERESGVFLTVLGVGTGNVQDSQMEMLADRGNGNYAYLDTIDEAGKVLVRELGGTLLTIAKDVKIQVEFNPARVGGYRLVGYENRRLAARDFNDDKKDAGEIGAGHSVTALYEILPAGGNCPANPISPPVTSSGRMRRQIPCSEVVDGGTEADGEGAALPLPGRGAEGEWAVDRPLRSVSRDPRGDLLLVDGGDPAPGRVAPVREGERPGRCGHDLLRPGPRPSRGSASGTEAAAVVPVRSDPPRWREGAGPRLRRRGEPGARPPGGGGDVLTLPGSVRIYLAPGATDMRKQFDGLAAAARSVVRQDPLSGAAFVFCNRRRHMLKVLIWDTSGFVLLAKRLEKGTFAWPDTAEPVEMRSEELALLLGGIDLDFTRRRPWYDRRARSA